MSVSSKERKERRSLPDFPALLAPSPKLFASSPVAVIPLTKQVLDTEKEIVFLEEENLNTPQEEENLDAPQEEAPLSKNSKLQLLQRMRSFCGPCKRFEAKTEFQRTRIIKKSTQPKKPQWDNIETPFFETDEGLHGRLVMAPRVDSRTRSHEANRRKLKNDRALQTFVVLAKKSIFVPEISFNKKFYLPTAKAAHHTTAKKWYNTKIIPSNWKKLAENERIEQQKLLLSQKNLSAATLLALPAKSTESLPRLSASRGVNKNVSSSSLRLRKTAATSFGRSFTTWASCTKTAHSSFTTVLAGGSYPFALKNKLHTRKLTRRATRAFSINAKDAAPANSKLAAKSVKKYGWLPNIAAVDLTCPFGRAPNGTAYTCGGKLNKKGVLVPRPYLRGPNTRPTSMIDYSIRVAPRSNKKQYPLKDLEKANPSEQVSTSLVVISTPALDVVKSVDTRMKPTQISNRKALEYVKPKAPKPLVVLETKKTLPSNFKPAGALAKPFTRSFTTRAVRFSAGSSVPKRAVKLSKLYPALARGVFGSAKHPLGLNGNREPYTTLGPTDLNGKPKPRIYHFGPNTVPESRIDPEAAVVPADYVKRSRLHSKSKPRPPSNPGIPVCPPLPKGAAVSYFGPYGYSLNGSRYTTPALQPNGLVIPRKYLRMTSPWARTIVQRDNLGAVYYLTEQNMLHLLPAFIEQYGEISILPTPGIEVPPLPEGVAISYLGQNGYNASGAAYTTPALQPNGLVIDRDYLMLTTSWAPMLVQKDNERVVQYLTENNLLFILPVIKNWCDKMSILSLAPEVELPPVSSSPQSQAVECSTDEEHTEGSSEISTLPLWVDAAAYPTTKTSLGKKSDAAFPLGTRGFHSSSRVLIKHRKQSSRVYTVAPPLPEYAATSAHAPYGYDLNFSPYPNSALQANGTVVHREYARKGDHRLKKVFAAEKVLEEKLLLEKAQSLKLEDFPNVDSGTKVLDQNSDLIPTSNALKTESSLKKYPPGPETAWITLEFPYGKTPGEVFYAGPGVKNEKGDYVKRPYATGPNQRPKSRIDFTLSMAPRSPAKRSKSRVPVAEVFLKPEPIMVPPWRKITCSSFPRTKKTVRSVTRWPNELLFPRGALKNDENPHGCCPLGVAYTSKASRDKEGFFLIRSYRRGENTLKEFEKPRPPAVLTLQYPDLDPEIKRTNAAPHGFSENNSQYRTPTLITAAGKERKRGYKKWGLRQKRTDALRNPPVVPWTNETYLDHNGKQTVGAFGGLNLFESEDAPFGVDTQGYIYTTSTEYRLPRASKEPTEYFDHIKNRMVLEETKRKPLKMKIRSSSFTLSSSGGQELFVSSHSPTIFKGGQVTLKNFRGKTINFDKKATSKKRSPAKIVKRALAQKNYDWLFTSVQNSNLLPKSTRALTAVRRVSGLLFRSKKDSFLIKRQTLVFVKTLAFISHLGKVGQNYSENYKLWRLKVNSKKIVEWAWNQVQKDIVFPARPKHKSWLDVAFFSEESEEPYIEVGPAEDQTEDQLIASEEASEGEAFKKRLQPNKETKVLQKRSLTPSQDARHRRYREQKAGKDFYAPKLKRGLKQRFRVWKKKQEAEDSAFSLQTVSRKLATGWRQQIRVAEKKKPKAKRSIKKKTSISWPRRFRLKKKKWKLRWYKRKKLKRAIRMIRKVGDRRRSKRTIIWPLLFPQRRDFRKPRWHEGQRLRKRQKAVIARRSFRSRGQTRIYSEKKQVQYELESLKRYQTKEVLPYYALHYNLKSRKWHTPRDLGGYPSGRPEMTQEESLRRSIMKDRRHYKKQGLLREAWAAKTQKEKNHFFVLANAKELRVPKFPDQSWRELERQTGYPATIGYLYKRRTLRNNFITNRWWLPFAKPTPRHHPFALIKKTAQPKSFKEDPNRPLYYTDVAFQNREVRAQRRSGLLTSKLTESSDSVLFDNKVERAKTIKSTATKFEELPRIWQTYLRNVNDDHQSPSFFGRALSLMTKSALSKESYEVAIHALPIPVWTNLFESIDSKELKSKFNITKPEQLRSLYIENRRGKRSFATPNWWIEETKLRLEAFKETVRSLTLARLSFARKNQRGVERGHDDVRQNKNLHYNTLFGRPVGTCFKVKSKHGGSLKKIVAAALLSIKAKKAKKAEKARKARKKPKKKFHKKYLLRRYPELQKKLPEITEIKIDDYDCEDAEYEPIPERTLQKLSLVSLISQNTFIKRYKVVYKKLEVKKARAHAQVMLETSAFKENLRVEEYKPEVLEREDYFLRAKHIVTSRERLLEFISAQFQIEVPANSFVDLESTELGTPYQRWVEGERVSLKKATLDYSSYEQNQAKENFIYSLPFARPRFPGTGNRPRSYSRALRVYYRKVRRPRFQRISPFHFTLLRPNKFIDQKTSNEYFALSSTMRIKRRRARGCNPMSYLSQAWRVLGKERAKRAEKQSYKHTDSSAQGNYESRTKRRFARTPAHTTYIKDKRYSLATQAPLLAAHRVYVIAARKRGLARRTKLRAVIEKKKVLRIRGLYPEQILPRWRQRRKNKEKKAVLIDRKTRWNTQVYGRRTLTAWTWDGQYVLATKTTRRPYAAHPVNAEGEHVILEKTVSRAPWVKHVYQNWLNKRRDYLNVRLQKQKPRRCKLVKGFIRLLEADRRNRFIIVLNRWEKKIRKPRYARSEEYLAHAGRRLDFRRSQAKKDRLCQQFIQNQNSLSNAVLTEPIFLLPPNKKHNRITRWYKTGAAKEFIEEEELSSTDVEIFREHKVASRNHPESREIAGILNPNAQQNVRHITTKGKTLHRTKGVAKLKKALYRIRADSLVAATTAIQKVRRSNFVPTRTNQILLKNSIRPPALVPLTFSHKIRALPKSDEQIAYEKGKEKEFEFDRYRYTDELVETATSFYPELISLLRKECCGSEDMPEEEASTLVAKVYWSLRFYLSQDRLGSKIYSRDHSKPERRELLKSMGIKAQARFFEERHLLITRERRQTHQITKKPHQKKAGESFLRTWFPRLHKFYLEDKVKFNLIAFNHVQAQRVSPNGDAWRNWGTDNLVSGDDFAFHRLVRIQKNKNTSWYEGRLKTIRRPEPAIAGVPPHQNLMISVVRDPMFTKTHFFKKGYSTNAFGSQATPNLSVLLERFELQSRQVFPEDGQIPRTVSRNAQRQVKPNISARRRIAFIPQSAADRNGVISPESSRLKSPRSSQYRIRSKDRKTDLIVFARRRKYKGQLKLVSHVAIDKDLPSSREPRLLISATTKTSEEKSLSLTYLRNRVLQRRTPSSLEVRQTKRFRKRKPFIFSWVVGNKRLLKVKAAAAFREQAHTILQQTIASSNNNFEAQKFPRAGTFDPRVSGYRSILQSRTAAQRIKVTYQDRNPVRTRRSRILLKSALLDHSFQPRFHTRRRIRLQKERLLYGRYKDSRKLKLERKCLVWSPEYVEQKIQDAKINRRATAAKEFKKYDSKIFLGSLPQLAISNNTVSTSKELQLYTKDSTALVSYQKSLPLHKVSAVPLTTKQNRRESFRIVPRVSRGFNVKHSAIYETYLEEHARNIVVERRTEVWERLTGERYLKARTLKNWIKDRKRFLIRSQWKEIPETIFKDRRTRLRLYEWHESDEHFYRAGYRNAFTLYPSERQLAPWLQPLRRRRTAYSTHHGEYRRYSFPREQKRQKELQYYRKARASNEGHRIYVKGRRWPRLRTTAYRRARSRFEFRNTRSAQKHFKKIMKRKTQTTGFSRNLVGLGNRLDVNLMLLGFFKTVFWARRYASYGILKVNDKPVVRSNYRLQPGDLIEFDWEKILQVQAIFEVAMPWYNRELLRIKFKLQTRPGNFSWHPHHRYLRYNRLPYPEDIEDNTRLCRWMFDSFRRDAGIGRR